MLNKVLRGRVCLQHSTGIIDLSQHTWRTKHGGRSSSFVNALLKDSQQRGLLSFFFRSRGHYFWRIWGKETPWVPIFRKISPFWTYEIRVTILMARDRRPIWTYATSDLNHTGKRHTLADSFCTIETQKRTVCTLLMPAQVWHTTVNRILYSDTG